LRALLCVGSNPVVRYNVDPFVLQNTFLAVSEMFMTETASLATVVFPAACAYEKAGTFTNTMGDLQMLKKAGDLTGTKPDFEIIVEIADRMGFDVHRLVPFGGGTRVDMGQSRGAQTGEADRHAVWLEAHNLEPKMTPFDPMAVLDEIQRLVPGYDVSRINLAAGNDQHTTALEVGAGSAESDPDLIVPSEDTLFTSGTMGRYSNALQSVIEARRRVPADKGTPV
jgi:NADH-quinone oxidoreductase subunit G